MRAFEKKRRSEKFEFEERPSPLGFAHRGLAGAPSLFSWVVESSMASFGYKLGSFGHIFGIWGQLGTSAAKYTEYMDSFVSETILSECKSTYS